MKQKLFLLFALILAVTQGWAMPIDSLRPLTLTQVGINSLGTAGVDGIDGINQVTSGDGTNSSSGTAIQQTISFDETPVGTSQVKYIYFKTDSRDNHFISYNAASGLSSASMYSFSGAIVDSVKHQYSWNTNPNYPYLGEIKTVVWYEYTWKIKVTYKPTTCGTHSAIFTFRKVTYNTLFLRYESSYQNYKCTGSAVRPTVTVNTSSISFGNVILGNSATRTIKVTGTNLTGNLTLSPNNSNFTVTPPTITPAQAAVGQTVIVKYTPSEVGNHSGVLKISGGGSSGASCQVNLTGTCVGNQTISANPSTWDFGTVNLGNEVAKTFTITGTNLNSRISVTNQMETTGGEFTVTPTDLPATGGTVTVRYKPLDPGSASAVFVFSSGEATTRITVSGKCVAPSTISVNPTSLAFGNVVKGNTSSKTFTVTGTNLTGSLTVSSSSSNFKVSPTTITAAQAAAGKTVTVTYQPTAEGSHSGTITISGGGATSKTVSVTGNCMVPIISVNPTSLAFGNVVKDNTSSKTFTVTGTNLTGSLTVSSSNSNFKVSTTTITAAQAAAGKTVTVTYQPTAAGSHSATINISGGGASSKTVSMTGNCVVPIISVNPTSLAFGNVVKDNTSSKTFTVTGTNLTGNLTVSSNNSNFKVSTTTITAAQAAAGKNVTVTYQPSAAGSHSGTITISGGGAASKTVSVTGKCVVPTISVSKTSLVFASKSSQTFKVTGTNLTGSLALIVKGGNGVFSASPTSITASQAANGVTVTVYCNPATNLQHASATIVISGGGASSKSVSLGYDSSNPEPMAGLILPDGEDEGDNEEFTNGGSLEFLGNSTTAVQELLQEAKIYPEGKNIIIESPVEQSAIISDVAGRARRVNLQAGRNEIPVNASGIYIVGIREKTAKLMIK